MIGTLLNNRYRLDAELGQGGMGVVYRGHDTLLERPVAVKVLDRAGLGSEGRVRLLREAQAAAKLNHPNIASVYDAGEDAGQAFIVMELVEGESLHTRRPQSLPEVLSIVGQVCAALEHAHAHGIIHRDLKPENILVAPDGTAKLSDFGLARSLASRLTSEGAVVGTVFYMAPEIALGQPVDGRADLYALGVMLYELTTGQLPFIADDPLAVISQHLHAPVVPPRALNAALPAALDALIVRLLEKQPEDRPASAGEVRALLASLDLARAAPGEEPARLERLARGRLVGRERELAEIVGHWRQAAAGDGHVLLITGEPGIGKTRLARELVTQCQVGQGLALLGECYSEGSGPYAPIAQLIRSALDGAVRDPLELPDFVLADLVTLAPDLRAHYPTVAPNPLLEPQAEQQRLFESVVALCSTLTARAPLLLFLDDIHWADSGTLFLLRHLARRMRGQRLLVVLTYREVELDQASYVQDVLLDLNRERLATRLKLTRFDLALTGEMLATMLAPSGEVDPSLTEAIYRETEGNPFFIEEVCKALIEEDKLSFQDGHWRAAATVGVEIPQSIRLTIQARLSKLPSPTQDTLRLAAVLGREFDFDTLARASDLDEEALIAALEVAERAQLISEVRGGPGGTRQTGQVAFAFAHALIPLTLRESTSGLRRQRLHRRALQAVEALHQEDFEVLAYHAEQAGDTEHARAYYRQAGDRALAIYANQEAERHYRAALETLAEEVGTAAERVLLLAGLGEALFREGRFREAIVVWQEAIALYQEQGDSDSAARLYARAARSAWYAGDTPGSLGLCQEGLAKASGWPESPGLAALLHEAGRAYFFSGKSDEALPLCERALEVARRLGAVEVQADTLSTLGLLSNQPPEQALQYQMQAVELAESAGLLFTAARAHINLANALDSVRGDPRGAREHFRRSRQLAQQMGLPAPEASALLSAVSMSLRLGDFADVESNLPVLQQLMNGLEPGILYPGIIALLEAALPRGRGELAEALQRQRACREDLLQHGDPDLLVSLDVDLAELCLEMGVWDEAEKTVQEMLQIKGMAPVAWPYVYATLAVLRARQGRIEEARQALGTAHEHAGAILLTGQQDWLAWAEANLAAAEGRYDDASTAYERGIQITAQAGMRWHQTRLLREWAEMHLARGQSGDRERAKDLLEQALTLLEQMGAARYAEQVRQQIEAL